MNDCSLKKMCLYFLKLGATGFGGPAALVNYMEKDLVEERGWITEDEFKEGFTLAQLAPGPLAAQVCIYIGWVRYRILGATLCSLSFIAPSFFMCLLFAYFYIKFQNLPWIQPVFYTVGASVIGIIVFSAQRLAKKAIGKDKLLLLLWAISALATAITESEELWLFLLAGIITMIWENPQIFRNKKLFSFNFLFLLVGINGLSNSKTALDILLYFTKAGAFVFGSGLAIVPFLHSGVVNEYHWLTERQFLDAVAVAMISPGPVVITVAFIGFLISGAVGAILASVGTFLPCYLFTVIPAPHFSKYAKNSYIKSFISGVTVAAVGAIAGASWVLGKRAIVDGTTFFIAAITILTLFKTKVKEPLIILFFSLIGFTIFLMKFY